MSKVQLYVFSSCYFVMFKGIPAENTSPFNLDLTNRREFQNGIHVTEIKRLRRHMLSVFSARPIGRTELVILKESVSSISANGVIC